MVEGSPREKGQRVNKGMGRLFFTSTIFAMCFFALCGDVYAFSLWPFGHAKKESPAATAADESALTLSEAYQLALKRSEELAMRHEDIEAAQGRFYGALSGALPHATYQASHYRQDSRETFGIDGASGNFLRQTTDASYFNVTQTLFSGFKEIAAVRATSAEKSQRTFEWRRARELLFQNVMEAFYAVIQARKDTEVSEKTKELVEQRIKEMSDRVQLGRSRESELYTTTVDLKLITVVLEEAKRTEAVWIELLEFYVGKPVTGGLVDTESPVMEMKSIDEYLGAVQNRADVKAGKEGKKAADNKAWAAKAELFPTISADANYYTKREGLQSDVDWDVLLKIEVPLFEGTSTIGDIKIAAAEQKSAELLASQVERSASMEIKNAYRNYASMTLQSDLLRDAAAAAEENYKTLSKEYDLSLVNNLEVLDALRQYQEVQRRHNQVHYEAKRNFWRLMTAIGKDYDAI